MVFLVIAAVIFGSIGFIINASKNPPRDPLPAKMMKRLFETQEERERNKRLDNLLDALEDEDE